jgi:hypothetical protein
MTATTIDIENASAEDALRLLDSALKLKGADYIYPPEIQETWGECKYRDPDSGEPSCIVGHALHELGLLDQADEGIGAFVMLRDMGFSTIFASAMSVAQDSQDNYHTWGEAVSEARGWVESHAATHSPQGGFASE